MNDQQKHRAGLGLPTACTVLATSVSVAAALTGSIAHSRHGTVAVVAVAVAALTCGLSGMAALVLAGRLAGTRWGIQGIMAAGFVRFSLPLLVVAASAVVQGPLSKAGLFGYMVIFFLIALVLETLLLLGVLRTVDSTDDRMAWKGQ